MASPLDPGLPPSLDPPTAPAHTVHWEGVSPSPGPQHCTGPTQHPNLNRVGIFTTQGLNPALPHCRRILHQLSHQGSPRILEWVAYPFSNGSSTSRNRTGVSCTADEETEVLRD
ncbi:unnamed protein product [Rangifer tarandus platyrhynchus]|uniref:Uncharacterized protein n=1 Tax=Rangifer tarandus platyrhynchus TaxID=3082113 RepID=A0ABN8YF77_RANTA|nr:unnamed protein product [Rangifer tarandus platyrhynchus]